MHQIRDALNSLIELLPPSGSQGEKQKTKFSIDEAQEKTGYKLLPDSVIEKLP